MIRENALSIFRAAVSAVHPSALMQQHVYKQGNRLIVCNRSFELPAGRPVWIFGAGKAAAAMAQALEPMLASVPVEGIIITKYGHGLPLQQIKVAEAGHPLPDENGVQATAQMVATLKKVQPGDVVLFLLSGGASALLADYPQHSSLSEVQEVFELLLKSGADIQEMNIVRKHLSAIKGGQLALLANTHCWCSLILSDVVGDDLSIIGSGPSVPDPSTFSDAAAILNKYDLIAKLPASLRDHLERGIAGEICDTPKPGHPVLQLVNNFLIGSNTIAIEAARNKAVHFGYATQVLTTSATGDATSLAEMLVATAKEWRGKRPACILMGGESTVNVSGTGLGGRNQHLALVAGSLLITQPGITVLSAGTDGSDGPTDAAGAFADQELMLSAVDKGLNAAYYLERHDAYHFFEKAGGLIKTGPTQTNVMDVMLAIIT